MNFLDRRYFDESKRAVIFFRVIKRGTIETDLNARVEREREREMGYSTTSSFHANSTIVPVIKV